MAFGDGKMGSTRCGIPIIGDLPEINYYKSIGTSIIEGKRGGPGPSTLGDSSSGNMNKL